MMQSYILNIETKYYITKDNKKGEIEIPFDKHLLVYHYINLSFEAV